MFKTLSVRSFGSFSRYAVKVVQTRFNAIEFFCFDAECPDEAGLPSIIGQADSLAQSLVNLPVSAQNEFLAQFPTRKGQKAVNLDRHPVKIVRIDGDRGILVECLGTKQRWYAPASNLVLI